MFCIRTNRHVLLMLLALFLGSILVVPVMAVEPIHQSTGRLDSAIKSGWIRMAIFSGRMQFSSTRHGGYSSSSSNLEKITIQSSSQSYTASYRFSNTKTSLRINITGYHQIRIESKPTDPSLPVVFEQPKQGDLTLSIGSGSKQEVLRAPTLWHLFLAYPKRTQVHLIPLLSLLGENQNLADTAKRIRNELVKLGMKGDLFDHTEWQALVEQLADERFSRRESADRELRAAGPVVVCFLKSLDPTTLDAEQQYRIHRICDSMTNSTMSDSTNRVAMWLASNPTIWVSILDSKDVSDRKVAVSCLNRLLSEPITFDPEADPATRKRQIETIRAQIDR